MNDIVLERHGQLVLDIFYWISPIVLPTNGELVANEEVTQFPEPETNCPLNREHQTGSIWRKPQMWLEDGPKFSEILPMKMTDSAIVITQWLADRLRTTKFRGFSLAPVNLVGNVSAPRNEPLLVVNFQGRRCFRHWKLVSKRNNSCGFCGKGPLICPSCNDIRWRCPECKQYPIENAEKVRTKDAHVLVISPKKDRWPDILEGSEWDGSDFISGGRMYCGRGLVSRRVLALLISLGVTDGYTIERVAIDVSKMTAEQRKKLDEVMKATPEEIKGLDQLRRTPNG